jgi:hypothetical protein
MNKIIPIVAAAAVALAITLAGAPEAAADTGKIVILEARQTSDANPWGGAAADAMRFQCLWLQRDIDYAGFVAKVEFESPGAPMAHFYNCRILLCHTNRTALVSNFNENYGGNTPVEVHSRRTRSMGGYGWINAQIMDRVFNYNNRDNVLMEIVWNGDSGRDVVCYLGAATARRCYAYNHQSPTGRVSHDSQRIRLTMGAYTGLEPTSLGRVKTLFQ